MERSIADVPRVQAACESGIGCSFYNCPAVGEQGHFVWLFPELQDEVSMADAAMRLKTLAQVAEINGAMMLVNLDGIPAAKRNVRTAGSSQMNKVS